MNRAAMARTIDRLLAENDELKTGMRRAVWTKRIEALELENEKLKHRVRLLEEMLETPQPLPEIEMTAQQLQIYRVLEKHPVATHSMIEAAAETKGWGREANYRIIAKSQICRPRRLGLNIRTIHGVGYELIREPA